ncbi:hypothetical protein BS47DRAFT_1388103 [Hydnum rufescens UP504]|uniref:Uncharacterized protein n=1 Tax=Hydnum rufescens UP504 TaxID=1448309 RepID=A0A9P6B961_9AGAM|nr:hypothetical protein BS47DRAFT_1388103 [Hydnum rufescens UP504]
MAEPEFDLTVIGAPNPSSIHNEYVHIHLAADIYDKNIIWVHPTLLYSSLNTLHPPLQLSASLSTSHDMAPAIMTDDRTSTYYMFELKELPSNPGIEIVRTTTRAAGSPSQHLRLSQSSLSLTQLKSSIITTLSLH